MASIYLMNGTAKARILVDAVLTDQEILVDIDSMVSITNKQEQKVFKGASPTPKEVHTIGMEERIKIQKCPFNKNQLSVLCGFTKDESDVLPSDDATEATTYTLTNAPTQRAVVDLLIEGTDDLTGKAIEIHAPKAVLINDFDFSMSVNDYSMQELEFLVLRGDQAATDTHVQIAVEN